MRTILLISAFAVALISGTSVIHFQTEAETLRARLVKENGEIINQVQHRLEDKVAKLTEGWLNIGGERRQRSDELNIGAQTSEMAALRWAWVSAAAFMVALVISFTFEGLSRRRTSAGVTMACWVLGLALPVLTLTLEAEVTNPVNLGKLLLREETKSLAALLLSLWEKNDVLMLTLVGIFGVVVPLIKTLCQFMPDHAHGALALSKFLSRWALVDVLVVGVIVAFLGSQGDKEAHATFRLGFWFFAASGVLSLASSWLSKTKEHPNRIKVIPSHSAVSHPFGSTF